MFDHFFDIQEIIKRLRKMSAINTIYISLLFIPDTDLKVRQNNTEENVLCYIRKSTQFFF